MSKEQLYFEYKDSTTCYPLEHFTSDARLEGKEFIKLVEANPDNSGTHIWCQHDCEPIERHLCKKSECPNYFANGGKGVCKYRGQLYMPGKNVLIQIV